MLRLFDQPPLMNHFCFPFLCITLGVFSMAINFSVALKRPERSFGAVTDSNVSSFTVVSTRVCEPLVRLSSDDDEPEF